MIYPIESGNIRCQQDYNLRIFDRQYFNFRFRLPLVFEWFPFVEIPCAHLIILYYSVDFQKIPRVPSPLHLRLVLISWHWRAKSDAWNPSVSSYVYNWICTSLSPTTVLRLSVPISLKYSLLNVFPAISTLS